MKHLLERNEFLNEEFKFGEGLLRKAQIFMDEVGDIFDGIVLPDNEIEEILENPSIKNGVASNIGFLKQVKAIVNDNKPAVVLAYNKAMGLKEGCMSGLIISAAFFIFIIYAQRRGWIDKLLHRIDPKLGKRPGEQGGGCCGPVEGDEWKYRKAKKPVARKPVLPPVKEYKPKVDRMDQILDKVAKRGYDSLTAEEKEFLNRKKAL